MPDGKSPVPPPDDFNIEVELNLVALSILASRHRDIPVPLLDDLRVHDNALRVEYETLVEKLRPAPRHPHSLIRWLLRYGQEER